MAVRKEMALANARLIVFPFGHSSKESEGKCMSTDDAKDSSRLAAIRDCGWRRAGRRIIRQTRTISASGRKGGCLESVRYNSDNARTLLKYSNHLYNPRGRAMAHVVRDAAFAHCIDPAGRRVSDRKITGASRGA
jgi:hypothetical protein